MIKGKTLVKCAVYDKPGSEKIIRTIGANVVITGSTRIIDVTGKEPVEFKGFVPPRSVVIPGTLPKQFPAGEYQVPCSLIIGKRKESTNIKTSLNDALREFNLQV